MQAYPSLYQSPFLVNLREAARLNAIGVTALSQPDSKGVTIAMTAFNRTFRLLRELSTDIPYQTVPLQQPEISQCLPTPISSNTCYYVYNQAKFFCPSSDEVVARSQLPVLSTIVIFNTALAYHRFGMETKASKYLAEAIKIYQNCGQVCLVQARHNDELLLLYMALANNAALIQTELAQKEGLRASTTSLRNCLKHVTTRERSMPTHHWDYIPEFELNAMSLCPEAPASAA